MYSLRASLYGVTVDCEPGAPTLSLLGAQKKNTVAFHSRCTVLVVPGFDRALAVWPRCHHLSHFEV